MDILYGIMYENKISIYFSNNNNITMKRFVDPLNMDYVILN